jgi:quercetin dioxygenase-like cupin family protein
MTDHTAQPIVLAPAEGRVIPGPEGLTLKATAEMTGGSIGLLESTSQPGFGPPRHIHHAADELFYVLDGHFEFLIGERVVEAEAGSFVFVPRGTVHAPKIVGPEPGRALIAFIPGGAEASFEEFAVLAAESQGPPDLAGARARAIASRYESEFVGPPL